MNRQKSLKTDSQPVTNDCQSWDVRRLTWRVSAVCWQPCCSVRPFCGLCLALHSLCLGMRDHQRPCISIVSSHHLAAMALIFGVSKKKIYSQCVGWSLSVFSIFKTETFTDSYKSLRLSQIAISAGRIISWQLESFCSDAPGSGLGIVRIDI